ncbi:hypothetical protein BV22DRAFT_861130 [Leucogyrophana mollusca]|uniref:Uncharacterized protein n=1 Tax=Leucogyrophana mollusca TaxID=85980 RepID=A0ACB8B160_9AGAM|nr:hypothetical protein BV22DRAFT_861130 [Leucogyrophana mollusca]
MNGGAGVPENGAELPGTTTRTQSLKIMMRSLITRTRGAWMPSVSWSALGGGGTHTRGKGVEPRVSLCATVHILYLILGSSLARRRVVVGSTNFRVVYLMLDQDAPSLFLQVSIGCWSGRVFALLVATSVLMPHPRTIQPDAKSPSRPYH